MANYTYKVRSVIARPRSARLRNAGVGTVNVNGGGGTTQGTASLATMAVQLANPRTLWGQPFDGTADVKGYMQDVQGIDCQGDIVAQDGNIECKSMEVTDNVIAGDIVAHGSVEAGQAIAIGQAVIEWDNTNKCLKIRHIDNQTEMGVYATGFISALGYQSGE